MKESEKIELIKQAINDVKNGVVPERNFIFIVDMIINEQKITEDDAAWARYEISRLIGKKNINFN